MSMLAVVQVAAVTAALTLQGSVPDDGNDYLMVDFEVPTGTAEMEILAADNSADNILDWGVFSPEGFRGYAGGVDEPAVIGVEESSRGYLPGPITPGAWQVMVGKAKILQPPANYVIEITFRTASTLSPRPRASPSSAALETGARWYAGDFHVHSRESGDAAATFDEIATLARQRGLDWVVLSDHNTVAQHQLAAAFQASAPGVLLVPGCEITTYGGHGNGVGIRSYVDHRVGHAGRTAAAIINDVDAQGGLFIINHPALDLGNACIGCAWEHADTPWEKVAGIELLTGPWASVGLLYTPLVITTWDAQLDLGRRITGVGGSDDHRAGQDTGSFNSPIGSPTTMLFATELSEPALKEALRAGRAVLKMRGPDDPMVELWLVGPTGQRAAIGEDVSAPSASVEVRVTGGAGDTVLVYRDGAVMGSMVVEGDDWTGRMDVDLAPAGGRFRVHLLEGDRDVVITNHVWAHHVPAPAPETPGTERACGCRVMGTDGPSWVPLVGVLLFSRQARARSTRRHPRQ